MNQAGVKKYIAVIWVLLITLTFSCLGLLVSNLVLNIKIENDDVSAADLTISSLSDLQSFANRVNGGDNFSGKTVVLSKDINCGGEEIVIGVNANNLYTPNNAIVPFAGKFDGQGNFISNFKLVDKYAHYDAGTAGRLYGCGFFAALDKSANVTKLGLKSFTITSNTNSNVAGTGYASSSIGGIAGFLATGGSGKASISQCLIDGLTINCSSAMKVGVAVGGIIGANPHVGATVTNCLINQIKFNIAASNYSWVNAGGVVGNDPSSGQTIVSVSQCLLNEKNRTSTISNGGNCNFYDFTSKPTTYCNTKGYTDGLDTTSIWYYNSNFNNKYPYLRVFMNFITFYFDCNGDGTYETTRTSPDPSKTIEAIKGSLTLRYIKTDYDNDVDAYGSIPNGKMCSGWALTTDDYHYAAVMVYERYGLRFYMPTGIECELIVNGTTNQLNSDNQAIKITDISKNINVVNYDQSIFVENKYIEGYLCVTFKIGEIVVTYKFSDLYYLKDYGHFKFSTDSKGEIINGFKIPDGGDGNTYDIKPNVVLKTYGTQFG